MTLKYLIPLLLLASCARPDAIEPVFPEDYTFDIWQCQSEDDLKLCYTIWVPNEGYSLEIKGQHYSYEIRSADQGCLRSSATVFAGDLWVTLKSGSLSKTKHLMIYH